MPGVTPVVAKLIDDRLMPLGPGRPNLAVRDRLQALTASDLFDAPIRDPHAAHACLSALWLLHDFLDESHSLSQDIPTREGSWWHAIMHRREPDASNSKYWFRRVGSHPVETLLVEQSPALGYSFRDSMSFVDFCERVRDSGQPDEVTAKKIQKLEWTLLFEDCLQKAIL